MIIRRRLVWSTLMCDDRKYREWRLLLPIPHLRWLIDRCCMCSWWQCMFPSGHAFFGSREAKMSLRWDLFYMFWWCNAVGWSTRFPSAERTHDRRFDKWIEFIEEHVEDFIIIHARSSSTWLRCVIWKGWNEYMVLMIATYMSCTLGRQKTACWRVCGALK